MMRLSLPSSAKEVTTWEDEPSDNWANLRKMQHYNEAWDVGLSHADCSGTVISVGVYSRPFTGDAYTGRFSKHKTWEIERKVRR